MHQPNSDLPIVGESPQQLQEQILQNCMAEIGQTLLVLSGKGGVGKSTVAANLATALAEAGKRVGLLDIDVHGPSIPRLMGVETKQVQGTEEEILPVKVSDNLAVMSIGFVLPTRGEPVIWRGPRKHSMIRQFLADVTWGQLGYLVVDSPPGAIIVTTPQEVAISDVC